MAVDFMKIFMSFMILGIMLFSIFSLIQRNQDVNNVDEKIADNVLMSNTFNKFDSNMSSLRDRSNALKTTFESDNPTTGFGSILLLSIVGVGKSATSMMFGIYNSVTTLPGVVLGVDPVLIGIITTMLILSLIIGAWVIYKLGG